MRKRPAGKWMTEEEFVRECAMTGLLGCYKFWVTLSGCPAATFEEFVAHGEALIRAMGALAIEKRGGVPATPNEAEFFEYCGRGKQS